MKIPFKIYDMIKCSTTIMKIPLTLIIVYREAFAMYDRKGKGMISTRHLGSLLRNLGQNPQEQELSDILDEFTDGSMYKYIYSFCSIMGRVY